MFETHRQPEIFGRQNQFLAPSDLDPGLVEYIMSDYWQGQVLVKQPNVHRLPQARRNDIKPGATLVRTVRHSPEHSIQSIYLVLMNPSITQLNFLKTWLKVEIAYLKFGYENRTLVNWRPLIEARKIPPPQAQSTLLSATVGLYDLGLPDYPPPPESTPIQSEVKLLLPAP